MSSSPRSGDNYNRAASRQVATVTIARGHIDVSNVVVAQVWRQLQPRSKQTSRYSNGSTGPHRGGTVRDDTVLRGVECRRRPGLETTAAFTSHKKICGHNCVVERGLVVDFCGQPHYCYRPYYPTARFRSPSSHMVSDEPFPDRSRPMSC